MLRAAMPLTAALGVAFLGLQSMAWLGWLRPAAERWDESGEWRFALTSFYVFTALHALHVIGGLIPMAVVASRAMRRPPDGYTADNQLGVQLCAMYWHFLGARTDSGQEASRHSR